MQSKGPNSPKTQHTAGEMEMQRKDEALQQVARNADLDIKLQDIVDGIEDELLVIDRAYLVKFSNSAVLRRVRK